MVKHIAPLAGKARLMAHILARPKGPPSAPALAPAAAIVTLTPYADVPDIPVPSEDELRQIDAMIRLKRLLTPR